MIIVSPPPEASKALFGLNARERTPNLHKLQKGETWLEQNTTDQSYQDAHLLSVVGVKLLLEGATLRVVD